MVTLFVVVAGLCAPTALFSDILLQWGPSGNNTGNFKTTGTDVPGNALSIDPAISIVQQGGDDYVLGAGLTTSTSYDSDTPAAWRNDDINFAHAHLNKANALSNNDYLSYIIEASAAVTITDLSWTVWLNGGGAPHEYAIYVGIGDSPTFAQAGSDFNFSTAGGDVGYDGGEPTPNALNNVTATGLSILAAAGEDVEIRLYAWGASSDAGNSHITGGIVEGVMVPVIPEPTSLALLGLGAFAIVRRRRTCRA